MSIAFSQSCYIFILHPLVVRACLLSTPQDDCCVTGNKGCSAVTPIKINMLCVNCFTFTLFGQNNVGALGCKLNSKDD